MNISTLNNQAVNAAELPLDKLASNKNVSEAQKVGEVSRQFEAVLLRQVIAQAQKPMFGGSTATSSTAGSVYQDMVVDSMADQISRSGMLGLGKSLAPQLSREVKALQSAATLSIEKHGNH